MKTHILPTFILGIFFLTGCYKMSPEERAANEKKVQDTYSTLGKVYEAVMASTLEPEPGKGCNGEKDTLYDGLTIPLIHIAALEKFTKTNAADFEAAHKAWVKEGERGIEESPWQWLNSANYTLDDTFTKWPSEFNNLKLGDAVYTLSDTSEGLMNTREWLVLVPDKDAENVMPKLISDEEFESGYFKGKVLLVDVQTLKVRCGAQIEVTNSESVGYTEYEGRRASLLNTFKLPPDMVIDRDFKDAFENQLARRFPGFKTPDLY